MFKADNLYQNDPAWKDVKLGLQDKETIGSWGCLLTSITMMINGFGFNETPVTVNNKMKVGGGFQGALIFPSFVGRFFPGVIFRGFDPCETSPAPLARIDNALAQNLPVIVQVDWNPQPGIQTHYVLLVDKEGNDYVMIDPYRYSGDAPGKKLLLTQRYKFTGSSPAQAITGVIWFEYAGHIPPTPPPPVNIPVPVDSFTVVTNVDNLALRAEPLITGDLIKRMPLGERLKTLESEAQAKPKAGVVGQWLRVEDSTGDQGYTAAWYCEEPAGDIPTDPGTAHPEPEPDAITLIPTVDGLAFRSQPLVADHTLIKRLVITTTLKALDADVETRVGQQGEWLKVEDITGEVGYVAAWYVTLVKNPAIGVREDPEDEPSLPAGLIVRTTVNKLALRQSPSVSNGTLIKRLPLRAELLVLDLADDAKIGVSGEWLHVRDLKGTEGYVAAWYVTK